MAKVTSKLQVTIPKAIAARYDINPGDEISWEASGQYIRVVPPRYRKLRLTAKERLKMFDTATQRQRQRQAEVPVADHQKSADRGWNREELYQRGSAD